MPSAPKILLVDDDPAVRASLQFSLGLEGFEVLAFESGEALLEQEDMPQDGCLVLDYRLPGIDGLTLLELLRTRGLTLPAVIVTTSPTRAVRALACDAGATLIEKPLLCDALTGAIRSLLYRPAQAA